MARPDWSAASWAGSPASPGQRDKDVQRGVFQSFNLFMNALTLAAYAMSGLITAEALRLFALVAVAMVAPTFLGARVYARLSHSAFRQLILVVLFLSGIVLLGASIPRLAAR
jgi:uncharacterized protein